MIPRRTILAALAAVSATTAAAQSQPDKMPGGADQAYVAQSLAISSVTLAASRMAAKKAQSDDLKEFAQLEEAEQMTLADVLKSMPAGNAGVAGRTVSQPGQTEVEQNLDQRGREILERLRTEPAGADFDRAYMGMLATGHLELLRIQEAYLDSGQNNANLVTVAKLARGTIKEHLQLLTDIESDMESASATTGAAPEKN